MEQNNGLEGQFVYFNHKKLKIGYTTGSCAAAAAKAAVRTLLTGIEQEEAAIRTPKGIELHLVTEDMQICHTADGSIESVSCAIRKDGGDDIDATHGALIYASVRKADTAGVTIDGGFGVGRVTRVGLDQPVGNAAINHVPREMITEAVEEICREQGYSGGISVEISVPKGEEIAQKTFNPRLGIVGGISILGTSGIVMPMSEKALVDTIRVEMRMHHENGGEYLVLTPGNYGERFASEMPDLVRTYEMKYSNFVGETLDMAVDMGIKGILIVSHIGKSIKLSGGIMNTHSHEADCRAELMGAAAARAGADGDLIRQILETNTTEDALDILHEAAPELFERTMQEILKKIEYYLDARCAGKMQIGAVIFSNTYGKLGETGQVQELICKLKMQG